MPADIWVILLYHVPAALLAVSIHEYGHAWVAYRTGDRSAAERLTLNPLAHLEPSWGFVLLFSRLWLRPFPDVYGGRRRVLVALGGPAANALLAGALLLLSRLLPEVFPPAVQREVHRLLAINVAYNLRFAAVNLLPLPPLDGARALAGLLPGQLGRTLDRGETAGLVILVLLIVSGTIDAVVRPIEGLLRAVLGAGIL